MEPAGVNTRSSFDSAVPNECTCPSRRQDRNVGGLARHRQEAGTTKCPSEWKAGVNKPGTPRGPRASQVPLRVTSCISPSSRTPGREKPGGQRRLCGFMCLPCGHGRRECSGERVSSWKARDRRGRRGLAGVSGTSAPLIRTLLPLTCSLCEAPTGSSLTISWVPPGLLHLTTNNMGLRKKKKKKMHRKHLGPVAHGMS